MSDEYREISEAIAQGRGIDVDGWDWPIPLTPVGKVPVFPAHRLPPWLNAYVNALATYLQVPVDMPAMLVLAALAVAAGGRAVAQPWDGWREPLNLYVAVAMPPGTRKTPVFQRIIRPLEHAEKLAAEAAAPEIAEARMRSQAAKAKADKAAKDAEVASVEASEEAIHFAAQQLLMAEAITVPHLPRLLADDCTPESLATLLCEQGGRIALFSDEGEVFGMMAGRYSTSGPNLGVYLKAHVGSPIRVDRKGRDPEFIENPAMTLGLTIQPGMLRDIAGIHGARHRGLLARFLWAVPPSNLGFRKTEDVEPVPEEIERQYQLYLTAMVQTLAEWTDPCVLMFSPEAKAVMIEYATRVEPRLADYEDLGHMPDWAGKLVGYAVRIAGLLHLATNIDTGWQQAIGPEVVRDAIRIADYLVVHASIAFDEMRFDPLIEHARAMYGWITERQAFSRRQIFKAYQHRFPTVADLKPVLDLLMDHVIIAEVPREKPTGRGRPRGPKYIVNPRIRISG